MNRQPNAVTKPPMTAVNLVDLRRQKAMMTGEANKLTAIDSAPSQPVIFGELIWGRLRIWLKSERKRRGGKKVLCKLNK